MALPATPTLANVGTLGLLAYRREIELAQFRLDARVVLAAGDFPLQPLWLPSALL